jgi:hypothetical protein
LVAHPADDAQDDEGDDQWQELPVLYVSLVLARGDEVR